MAEMTERGVEFRGATPPHLRLKLITDGPYKGWICRWNEGYGNWVTVRLATLDEALLLLNQFAG